MNKPVAPQKRHLMGSTLGASSHIGNTSIDAMTTKYNLPYDGSGKTKQSKRCHEIKMGRQTKVEWNFIFQLFVSENELI